MSWNAVLVLSFGGPENRDEVIPFLENVLRGKRVPRERMLEVAGHYYHFAGASPINDQSRALVKALESELAVHGPRLPVYWGNRNWHPFLADTLRRMRDDGITRALAFVTSAFSSYSGCRQYLEDIDRARTEAGAGAPEIDKLRIFYNHPGFIETMTDRVVEALGEAPAGTPVILTAHSLPVSMAQGSPYVDQLHEACRLVAASAALWNWTLAYQSRSGPPSEPWLGPDIETTLRDLAARGSKSVVVVPIGFLSDHMEVAWDLDNEARQLCTLLGLSMVRAGTAGVHPRFIRMIRELILERTEGAPRLALGSAGPRPDVCPEECCPRMAGPRAG